MRRQVAVLGILCLVTVLLRGVSDLAWTISGALFVLALFAFIPGWMSPPSAAERKVEKREVYRKIADIETKTAGHPERPNVEHSGIVTVPATHAKRVDLVFACLHAFEATSTTHQIGMGFKSVEDGDLTTLAKARIILEESLKPGYPKNPFYSKELDRLTARVNKWRTLTDDALAGRRSAPPSFDLEDYARRLEEAFPRDRKPPPT